MSTFKSDTIDEFLQKTINRLIETHDPDKDGSSTGELISIYQQLKDEVREGIPYTHARAVHIAKRMVEIAPDQGETCDSNDIQELADEVNNWD